MQQELLFDTIEAYVNELKELRIKKIAFAETNEKRAEQVEAQMLLVKPVRKVELLAYKDAIIYKCVMNDADLDRIHDDLVGQGFEVTRRSRNIT